MKRYPEMKRFGQLMIAMTILAVLVVGAIKLTGSRFSQAPNMTFNTITGEKLALQQWRGHPVLVTFWASDCRSCIEEIPLLTHLYHDYASKGLKVIAIAMYYDPPNHVLAMARLKNLPYPVALDPVAELAKAFADVQWVPNTFLFAPDGTLSIHQSGLLDGPQMRATIERMLDEKQT